MLNRLTSLLGAVNDVKLKVRAKSPQLLPEKHKGLEILSIGTH